MRLNPRTLVTLLGLLPAFLLTNTLTHAARDRRQQLAVFWSGEAERDLVAGRAGEAVDAFRTAREYSGDPDRYRLQLGRALAAAGEPAQAEAQLITLWAQAPGDAVVNLELGRIAAMSGGLVEAMRYYHAAIDGAWEGDAPAARRAARRELAIFLLDRGARVQAQSELVALAGDLPADAGQLTDGGMLLLRAGSDDLALKTLRRALAIEPANGRAARLSGEAAFHLGDYREAQTYLRTPAAQPLDPAAADMLDVSTRVLEIDPFAASVSARDRLRRVTRAYEVAAEWLDECPPEALAPLRAEAHAAASHITERDLARDPDAVDTALGLVGRIEAAASAACGRGSPDARALLLVLRQRRPTT